MEERFLTTLNDVERIRRKYQLSSAFDQLWVCYSLGRSARDIYRYGHRRGCGEVFAHFRFCLSLKLKEEDEWWEAVKKRETDLAITKAKEPNAYDVWQDRPLPPAAAAES